MNLNKIKSPLSSKVSSSNSQYINNMNKDSTVP